MAITDNKTFGWNISLWQGVAVLVLLGLVVATIASGQLKWGYVVMTLVLSGFFAVVAFDIGVRPTSSKATADDRES